MLPVGKPKSPASSRPVPVRSWNEVWACADSVPVNTHVPTSGPVNWPLTLATSVRLMSVPASEPLPLPVNSGGVSELNTMLVRVAMTLPLSSPLPVNAIRYCTG